MEKKLACLLVYGVCLILYIFLFYPAHFVALIFKEKTFFMSASLPPRPF
jgi:hypothetical protein